MQGGCQEASLAAVQHSRCLLMLTLPAGSAHSGGQLAALSAALQGPLKQLAAHAAEHFGALRQGHISGLRYPCCWSCLWHKISGCGIKGGEKQRHRGVSCPLGPCVRTIHLEALLLLELSVASRNKQLAVHAAEHFGALRQGHLSGLRYCCCWSCHWHQGPPAKAAQLRSGFARCLSSLHVT